MIDKKMLDRVKELSQYRLVDERPVEEMNSYGMVLEHKKSGARIFLMSCEDDHWIPHSAPGQHRTSPYSGT